MLQMFYVKSMMILGIGMRCQTFHSAMLCEKYDDSGHRNEMSNSALCSVKYMKSMYVKYMDMNLMMLCQACEF